MTSIRSIKWASVEALEVRRFSSLVASFQERRDLVVSMLNHEG
jgi:hypothetical protein